MLRGKQTVRAIMAVSLGLSLMSASVLALSGCTADPRLAVIDHAVLSAVSDSAPHLLGVRTRDVAQALADVNDESIVVVPVLVPDLGTADAAVTATSDSGEIYTTAALAADALAGLGRTAWEEWLKSNPGEVSYVETSVPVTISTNDDHDFSVDVDDAEFQTFAQPLEETNIELFVHAAQGLTQWQQTMVSEHLPDYMEEVTGVRGNLAARAKLENADPVSDGLFRVRIKHPDPAEIITYQAQKAVESYGSGKIWGEVTRADFESRLKSVTSIPSSIRADSTSEATVKISASDDGKIDRHLSLEANLAAQSTRYQAEAESGSFTPPSNIDKLASQAVDAGLAKISARVVKEQKRPWTTKLIAGGSGMSVSIKTGKGADMHVTFFQWGTTKQVVSVFIRKGQTLTVRIPTGQYRIVLAEGDAWYGPQHSFGPHGFYTELKADSRSTGPLKLSVEPGYVYRVGVGLRDSESSNTVPMGTVKNPYGS